MGQMCYSSAKCSFPRGLQSGRGTAQICFPLLYNNEPKTVISSMQKMNVFPVRYSNTENNPALYFNMNKNYFYCFSRITHFTALGKLVKSVNQFKVIYSGLQSKISIVHKGHKMRPKNKILCWKTRQHSSGSTSFLHVTCSSF